MPRKSKGNLYKKEGSPFWWYEFQVGSQRHRASTGTRVERDARTIAKTAKEQAKADAKVDARRAAAAQNLPIEWELDEVADKYDAATEHTLAGWRNVHRDIVRIVEFMATVVADEDGEDVMPLDHPAYKPPKAVRLITDIRDGHVNLLVRARRMYRVVPKHTQRKPEDCPFVSPGTVNHTVVRLQAIFAYAKKVMKLRLPDEPVWANHKLEVTQKDARVFVNGEKPRFDMATSPSFAPVFAFAYESAKRMDYCATLRWTHVHWDRGVIKRPGKSKPGGKEKIEDVSITPEIRAILEPLIGQHPEFVFSYEAKLGRSAVKDDPATKFRVKGRRYPIKASYLETEFKRTCKRAGIEHFGFHSLRRSGATEFYDATGNDLLLTQRFLAHASPQTTARYIRRDDKDVRAGMEKRAALRAAKSDAKTA